jgi:hypothetical protein
MNKLLATIVSGMLLGVGAAFAQTSQSHPVEVRIPGVMMIRLTSGTSNDPVRLPTPVQFDLTTVPFEPIRTYSPTNLAAANWNNVRVFVNRAGTWRVTVATDNNLFPWGRVRVIPSGGFYRVRAFNLPLPAQSPRTILTGAGPTGGWRSLGFGPARFRLRLTGTEAAGTFSTTVTYAIVSP